MTRDEIVSELERVRPILKKYTDYVTALKKELDNLENPQKTLDEMKTDIDKV